MPAGVVKISLPGGDPCDLLPVGIARVHVHPVTEPGPFTESVHKPETPLLAVVERQIEDHAPAVRLLFICHRRIFQIIEKGARPLDRIRDHIGRQVEHKTREQQTHQPERTGDPQETASRRPHRHDLVVTMEAPERKQERNEKGDRQNRREINRQGQTVIKKDLPKPRPCVEQIRQRVIHVLQDENPQDHPQGQRKADHPFS